MDWPSVKQVKVTRKGVDGMKVSPNRVKMRKICLRFTRGDLVVCNL
jgi:hypothetical protein